jgi:hypothetical protein
MTFAARALELFLQRPGGENRIDWLANQLLGLAIDAHSLTFRIVPLEGGNELVFECSDSLHLDSTTNPGPLRLFRTLLARFAKMAEEENGTFFNPYGGKLYFNRNTPGGLVRVNVEFVNSGDVPSLTLGFGSIETPLAESLNGNLGEHQELLPPK